MRSYGKRFLREKMRVAAAATAESRDAIIWDVLPASRVCRVKIQGSNNLVYAHYPENWESTPFWMKKGNAVRIAHRSGVRGYVEVMGHGRAVPTPVSGGQFPDQDVSEDCVISGGNIFQSYNNPKMTVYVQTAVIRIGGTEYTLDALTMAYGDYLYVGDGHNLESLCAVKAINAAPAVAGQFRYDIIVVGTDLVIDYIAGTASATPSVPSVPALHVQLGRTILVPYGATPITQDMIGATVAERVPSTLVMTIADNDLAWGELTTDVEVTMYDQYGNLISGTGAGYYIKLEILNGNGAVSSTEEGSSTDEIGQHTFTANHVHFTYTRDGLDPGDSSPALMATLESDRPISAVGNITLRDAAGDPIF